MSRPQGDDPASGAGVEDPVLLVGRIAESLPALDAAGLERLAAALDELTEAVGLLLPTDDE